MYNELKERLSDTLMMTEEKHFLTQDEVKKHNFYLRTTKVQGADAPAKKWIQEIYTIKKEYTQEVGSEFEVAGEFLGYGYII